MQGAFFVVIAILAVSLLAGRELVHATTHARRKGQALARATDDLNRCFDLTERALSDDRVSPYLKAALINQTAALTDSKIGKASIEAFLKLVAQNDGAPEMIENPLGEAIDHLACVDPKLAAECRSAFGEGLVALLLMHADAFTVEDAALEAVRSPYGVPAGIARMFGGSGLAPV
ncbi:hypothetical protein [Methylobacterium sp. J-068]|uniref:hypothetical protein n=1 Tax=Methylobacterium sp. J-068 TaxID=2836649 RepID=UPI001FBAC4DB|nr:hypothetical protein [Methylobacterium sp. J-068]MCJ2033296.1 hypothetical protein [Methylobacterium sp. J-068]